MCEGTGKETLMELVRRYAQHYGLTTKEAGTFIRKDLREAIEELMLRGET